ncbi:unnamed protein product, partial [Discosporangium mesarthrocarpum]
SPPGADWAGKDYPMDMDRDRVLLQQQGQGWGQGWHDFSCPVSSPNFQQGEQSAQNDSTDNSTNSREPAGDRAVDVTRGSGGGGGVGYVQPGWNNPDLTIDADGFPASAEQAHVQAQDPYQPLTPYQHQNQHQHQHSYQQHSSRARLDLGLEQVTQTSSQVEVLVSSASVPSSHPTPHPPPAAAPHHYHKRVHSYTQHHQQQGVQTTPTLSAGGTVDRNNQQPPPPPQQAPWQPPLPPGSEELPQGSNATASSWQADRPQEDPSSAQAQVRPSQLFPGQRRSHHLPSNEGLQDWPQGGMRTGLLAGLGGPGVRASGAGSSGGEGVGSPHQPTSQSGEQGLQHPLPQAWPASSTPSKQPISSKQNEASPLLKFSDSPPKTTPSTSQEYGNLVGFPEVGDGAQTSASVGQGLGFGLLAGSTSSSAVGTRGG